MSKDEMREAYLEAIRQHEAEKSDGPWVWAAKVALWTVIAVGGVGAAYLLLTQTQT